jgi:hypothetical protein
MQQSLPPRGLCSHASGICSKSKYGALDIVAHKVGDDQVSTGYQIMMDLIANYPELRGVFASSLAMAKGAALAVAEKETNLGGDLINVVCFGADNSLVELLRAARSPRLSCRIRSAWVTTASRPRSQPLGVRPCREISIPEQF